METSGHHSPGACAHSRLPKFQIQTWLVLNATLVPHLYSRRYRGVNQDTSSRGACTAANTLKIVHTRTNLLLNVKSFKHCLAWVIGLSHSCTRFDFLSRGVQRCQLGSWTCSPACTTAAQRLPVRGVHASSPTDHLCRFKQTNVLTGNAGQSCPASLVQFRNSALRAQVGRRVITRCSQGDLS